MPDDRALLYILAEVLRDRAGGEDALRRHFPPLIRRALDEVIDTPRSGRLTFDELEKTEKTYVGTKVEILLRDYLDLPRGVSLDVSLNGTDVDIKNTTGTNWMIPTEAVDHPCILVRESETRFVCSLGLFMARLDNLTAGSNKDSKRRVSAAGKRTIVWLLEDEPYPANFWASVTQAQVDAIHDRSVKATERLTRLFTLIQDTPISRKVIADVARQLDPMKRIRANGGARDRLERAGIALLSGKYDRDRIDELGLPTCAPDDVISTAI